MKYSVSVSSPVSTSFRAAAIIGKFDYDPGARSIFSFEAELPTDREDWQVGLIVGPSGSGKSLLARQAFPAESIVEGFTWGAAAIVDDFPGSLSVNDVTRLLTAVGLSSTPVWLLPYAALSNGQRFRADLARALATSDYAVYDEFTSVVDRDVAKAAAYAVSKEIRRRPGKRFVAISCHSDIIEWLEPDWVYRTEDHSLHWGRLRRPQIILRIYPGSYRAYPLFAHNHYLGRPIPRHATVFLGVVQIEERKKIVAIDSYHAAAGVAGLFIGGAGVVLPDFQGLGIGMRFFEAAAEFTHRMKGVRVRNIVGSQVVNDCWARRAGKDDAAWRLVRGPHRNRPDSKTFKRRKGLQRATNRLVCSWEYVPEAQRRTRARVGSGPAAAR